LDTSKFTKQDRNLVVEQLAKLQKSKLSASEISRTIFVDETGKYYCIIGGTSNWHGISPNQMFQLEQFAKNMVFVVAKKYKTRIDVYVAPMMLLMAHKNELPTNKGGNYQFHTIPTEDGLYLFESPQVYLQKVSEFAYGDGVIQPPFDVRNLINLESRGESEPTAIDEPVTHSDIESKIIIIGNSLGYRTYTPDPSKNSRYGILGNLCSEKKLPTDYIFPRQVNTIKNIDVIWFDSQGFPTHCFEVEHTTDITKGLLRLYQIQKLPTKMFIVADDSMRRKFETEIKKDPFFEIRDRYMFRAYNEVDDFLKSAKEFVMRRTNFLNEGPQKWSTLDGMKLQGNV
jgi:hypothetical protein